MPHGNTLMTLVTGKEGAFPRKRPMGASISPTVEVMSRPDILLLNGLLGRRLFVYPLRGLLDGRCSDLLYLLATRLSRSEADQEQHQ